MPQIIDDPVLQPCPQCHNADPRYAIGYDRQGYYYIRCRKCNKYVFTDEDLTVVRNEMMRLNGRKTD